jgi:hypothetical protein
MASNNNNIPTDSNGVDITTLPCYSDDLTSVDLLAVVTINGQQEVVRICNVNLQNILSGTTPDTTPPTLVITSSLSTLTQGQTATLTFTFSEAVQGFVLSDIMSDFGSVASLSQISQTVYTAVYTPPDNTDATVTISVLGSSYFDDAGLTGADASFQLLINTVDNDPHLFWRLVGDTGASLVQQTDNNVLNTVFGISELEFLSNPSGSQLAIGGTALAFGTNNTNDVPANAFDQATNNQWSLNPTGVTDFNNLGVGYQFLTPVNVNTVRIIDSSNNTHGLLDRMKVQFSDDGTNWSTRLTIIGERFWQNGYIRLFDRERNLTGTRGVRLLMRNRVGVATSIGQIELRETVGGPDLTFSSATIDQGNSFQSGNASGGSGFASFGSPAAFNNSTSASNGWRSETPIVVDTTFIGWVFPPGSDVTIAEVLIREGVTTLGSIEPPEDFDIQVSSDLETWVTVLSVTGETGWAGGEERLFVIP